MIIIRVSIWSLQQRPPLYPSCSTGITASIASVPIAYNSSWEGNRFKVLRLFFPKSPLCLKKSLSQCLVLGPLWTKNSEYVSSNPSAFPIWILLRASLISFSDKSFEHPKVGGMFILSCLRVFFNRYSMGFIWNMADFICSIGHSYSCSGIFCWLHPACLVILKPFDWYKRNLSVLHLISINQSGGIWWCQ